MANTKTSAKNNSDAKKIKELEKTISDLNAVVQMLMKQGVSTPAVETEGERDVVFISLCNHILNLSTEPNGGGTIYTFTELGEEQAIPYSDARKKIKNNKVIVTVGIVKFVLEVALTEFKDYYGRELGYVLSKDYWGKGLMPEAVNAVKDYLFGELDYDFLICGYYDFNEQSKRVQTKCGFKPYRSLVMTTQMETKEQGTLMLLLNSKKNIKLVFSHPETLISENW